MGLLGYKEVMDDFSSAFKIGKMHHAWLLYGDKGIGKASFAHLIAQAVLSNKEVDKFSFDVDEVVSTKIKHGSHPDCHILSPDDKGSIGVDEVRQLVRFLHLTAVEGKYKIAIIDTCDSMTINAANALLKILEEPPAGALLLLVCNSIGKVLPTVRSRCRTLKINTPALDVFNLVISEKHHEILREQIDELHNLCQGSIGLALKIVEQNALSMVSDIKRQIEGKDEAGLIKMGQLVATNQTLWEIAHHFIIKFLQDKIKMDMQSGKSCSSLLERLNKSTSTLSACDKFYLDKSSVLITVLGAI